MTTEVETREQRESRLLAQRPLWLNVGSNEYPVEGYLNVDIVEAFNPDILDNAITLEKVANNSVAQILASHILEHVDDPASALIRWYDVLEPGGICMIYVPNHTKAVELWATGQAFKGLGDPVRGFLGCAAGYLGAEHLHQLQEQGNGIAEAQRHKVGFSFPVLDFMCQAVGFITEVAPEIRYIWEMGLIARKPIEGEE